jgi:hypothetical protein
MRGRETTGSYEAITQHVTKIWPVHGRLELARQKTISQIVHVESRWSLWGIASSRAPHSKARGQSQKRTFNRREHQSETTAKEPPNQAGKDSTA